MTARLRTLPGRTGPVAGFLALALTALAAPACDDSPTSPGGVSTLTVMLTDAPLADVQQVNIFFTGVTVKRLGESVQRLDLQLVENPVNLVALDNQVVTLATGAVEPGSFEYIQVEIDPTRSNVVVDGVTKAISTPSTEVKILGTFTVDDDGTDITLDFDASKSVLPLGNGDYLLKPVIVKVENGGSG